MLTGEKRDALVRLVGASAANEFLTQLAGREKSASASGIAFKSLGGDAEMSDMIRSLLSDFTNSTEKAAAAKVSAPGEPPAPVAPTTEPEKKAAPIDEAADGEDVEEPEEAETEVEVAVGMTPEQLGQVADMIAERLMAQLDSINTKVQAIDEEMKSRGYSRVKSANDDLAKSLKSFTDQQTEFATGMLKAVEEIQTRLKALEASGTGYAPSMALDNLIGQKSASNGLSPAEQGARNMWFS
jgi:hypothetical protein